MRTTHMTGIVTDLGLAVGHALRGREQDWTRFRLHLVLLGGFIAGGVGGAVAFGSWGPWALAPAIALTGSLGGGYAVWQHAQRAYRSDTEQRGTVPDRSRSRESR